MCFVLLKMWGIEFFDEAAKSRRSSKMSPKRRDSISPKKQEEKAGIINKDQASTSRPNASSSDGDKASFTPSLPSARPAVSSEQAEPRPEVTNHESSEEKGTEHVTVEAVGSDRKRHVTPNLRDESIDDGYVIIERKGGIEEEQLARPGI